MRHISDGLSGHIALFITSYSSGHTFTSTRVVTVVKGKNDTTKTFHTVQVTKRMKRAMSKLGANTDIDNMFLLTRDEYAEIERKFWLDIPF